MPLCRDATADKPVEWFKEVLRQHPDKWPTTDWVGWPNAVQAVRDLLSEAVNNPPAPPTWPINRGVVICGGGWRFFPSVYVTVRVLRHVGCRLPIQVWYLGDAGEFDPRMAECLDDYGVGWIDANSWWRENPQYRIRRVNIDHGWMLKPFAVLGAPFREVFFLDADAYPVYALEKFMDHPEHKRVGATFWPDFKPLESGQWERFGVAPHDVSGLESGQFTIDKARHWRALWGACLLNALHDFSYRHVYGDKDTFGIAWRRAGLEMCIPTKTPGWHVHTFIQKDFDGNPFILHRTRDKFRLTGAIDGQGISEFFNTRQLAGVNRFEVSLPHEAFCFEALNLVDRLLRPETHFDLTGHPAEMVEWSRINRENAYRFASAYPPGGVALDIGANLGGATTALLDRGMSAVFAVEPAPCLQDRLRRNLLRYGTRARIIARAVWSHSRKAEPLRLYRRETDPDNTCQLSCCLPWKNGEEVSPVRLDALIRMALAVGLERVRLIKIDVEGAEYPALFAADLLGLVDEIVGEWHEYPGVSFELPGVGKVEALKQNLFALLQERGFQVFWEQYTDENGLFWATRPDLVGDDCCP